MRGALQESFGEKQRGLMRYILLLLVICLWGCESRSYIVEYCKNQKDKDAAVKWFEQCIKTTTSVMYDTPTMCEQTAARNYCIHPLAPSLPKKEPVCYRMKKLKKELRECQIWEEHFRKQSVRFNKVLGRNGACDDALHGLMFEEMFPDYI